ncbi:sensor domain-containing protein [Actinoplanes sp. NPDC089786]|uniref:sensor histidine kinase n=1 Tax=Actinoplanes sp. NPDC089786 TaxID=3155185 RepID=UPI003420D18F
MKRWFRGSRDVLVMVSAGLAALALILATLASALLCLVGIGLPLLDLTFKALRRRANRRRRRLDDAPAPYPVLPDSIVGRLRAQVCDVAIWRDLTWALASFVLLLPGGLIIVYLWMSAIAGLAAPLLLVFRPDGATLSLNGQLVTGPATAGMVVLQALSAGVLAFLLQILLLSAERLLAGYLLRPTRRAVLAGRLAELNENRADALDSWEAKLRRIERDLHDGAQAQLTALTMNLGMAEQLAGEDEPVRRLVADARASASTALEGLRDIVRGIHPPVLAERGLSGGLEELALAAAVPVQLSTDVPRSLPAPLESALYFTAAELITNATRHSGCDQIDVTVATRDGMIRMTVRDNGAGDMVPRAGGGIEGLRRRLSALDGRLRVDSPTGGPTVITAEMPCVS